MSTSARDIENMLKKQKDKRERGTKKDKKAEAGQELRGAKNARGQAKREVKKGILELDWSALQFPGLLRLKAGAGEADAGVLAPCVRVANDVDEFMTKSTAFQSYLERFLSQAMVVGCCLLCKLLVLQLLLINSFDTFPSISYDKLFRDASFSFF